MIPTLEVGELAGYALPTPQRAHAWLRAAPRVGNHLFVKLFGHGAHERNGAALLEGGGLDRCLAMVRDECSRRGWRLGFMSAWEATRLLHELASGECAADQVPDWITDGPRGQRREPRATALVRSSLRSARPRFH